MSAFNVTAGSMTKDSFFFNVLSDMITLTPLSSKHKWLLEIILRLVQMYTCFMPPLMSLFVIQKTRRSYITTRSPKRVARSSAWGTAVGGTFITVLAMIAALGLHFTGWYYGITGSGAFDLFCVPPAVLMVSLAFYSTRDIKITIMCVGLAGMALAPGSYVDWPRSIAGGFEPLVPGSIKSARFFAYVTGIAYVFANAATWTYISHRSADRARAGDGVYVVSVCALIAIGAWVGMRTIPSLDNTDNFKVIIMTIEEGASGGSFLMPTGHTTVNNAHLAFCADFSRQVAYFSVVRVGEQAKAPAQIKNKHGVVTNVPISEHKMRKAYDGTIYSTPSIELAYSSCQFWMYLQTAIIVAAGLLGSIAGLFIFYNEPIEASDSLIEASDSLTEANAPPTEASAPPKRSLRLSQRDSDGMRSFPDRPPCTNPEALTRRVYIAGQLSCADPFQSNVN